MHPLTYSASCNNCLYIYTSTQLKFVNQNSPLRFTRFPRQNDSLQGNSRSSLFRPHDLRRHRHHRHPPYPRTSRLHRHQTVAFSIGKHLESHSRRRSILLTLQRFYHSHALQCVHPFIRCQQFVSRPLGGRKYSSFSSQRSYFPNFRRLRCSCCVPYPT